MCPIAQVEAPSVTEPSCSSTLLHQYAITVHMQLSFLLEVRSAEGGLGCLCCSVVVEFNEAEAPVKVWVVFGHDPLHMRDT